MTIEPGLTLSHYRLVEKIGEGGMGVVWKAKDTVLRRTVAIKVLPAAVASDEGRRRMFLDEARLASSVSDAHIAQVYELGRERDLDFIVMEYVEGQPLNRILDGRPLPTDQVVTVGRQVAQALSRAHRKGLLHRDLKPSNILVTPEGEAKVVDFGLATLLGPQDVTLASSATTQTVTQDEPGLSGQERKGGGLVGTPPYMSPEQVRAEKLDARSDIFSLGATLYEMTTGQRPFLGLTPAETLREVLIARPKPPRAIVPEVPHDLERIIEKALAPARADRYQTMDDLAVDLKRLARALETGDSPSFDELFRRSSIRRRRLGIWGAAGAVAAGLLAASLWRFQNSGRSVVDSRTLLILPLASAGQSEGESYTGQAFAEAIAVNLAQSKDLTVLPVAENSDLNQPTSLQRAAAAARLGAGRLLTSALTREGRTVHARLSLVDTARNRIVWGTQKDEEDTSLSRLAASLSGTIAGELGAKFRTRYEYPLNMTGSPAMASSQVTVEALGALRRYQSQRALDLTEKLLQEFPVDPDALSLRSYAILHAFTPTGQFFISTPAGKTLLDGTLGTLDRVDPNNPIAAMVRCEILGTESRWKDLMACADGVVSRDDVTPAARAWALRNRGSAKQYLGETSAALADIKEASTLDPTNHYNFQGLGLIREKLSDLEGAATALRQCNALAPEYSNCHWYLYRVLETAGKSVEAVRPAERLCVLNKTRNFCAAYAHALMLAGRRNDALQAANDAERLPGGAGGDYDLARTRAIAGDRDEALRLLRLATRRGSPDRDTLKNNSFMFGETDFAPYRNDAEFMPLIAELNRFLDAGRARNAAGP